MKHRYRVERTQVSYVEASSNAEAEQQAHLLDSHSWLDGDPELSDEGPCEDQTE